MARYIARPKAWVEDEDAWDYPISDHIPTVCESDAIDTGLCDAGGNPIFRMNDPIGFLHFE